MTVEPQSVTLTTAAEPPPATKSNPAPPREFGPEGNESTWKPSLPADAPPGAYCRMGDGWVDSLGQPVKAK